MEDFSPSSSYVLYPTQNGTIQFQKRSQKESSRESSIDIAFSFASTEGEIYARKMMHSKKNRIQSNTRTLLFQPTIRSHVEYWTCWLQNDSIEPRKRLLEALQHANISAAFARLFALNCAQHALSQTPYLISTLQHNAQSILGKGYLLQEHSYTCTAAYPSCTQWKRLQTDIEALFPSNLNPEEQRIVSTLLGAFASCPHTAARYASKDVYIESERQWQCAELLRCLQALHNQRQQLVHILQKRKVHLQAPLLQWHTHYEEQLF